MSKKNGLAKFLIGASIGVGLGVLFAPKSGKETRADLKKKMDQLLEKAKSIDIEEVKETIQKKVEEIKSDLQNLDKETALEKAKDGAKKIKKKADDLVAYAVKKGTPVIEAASKEVRESTIKTLENILAKLKDDEEKKSPKKKNK